MFCKINLVFLGCLTIASISCGNVDKTNAYFTPGVYLMTAVVKADNCSPAYLPDQTVWQNQVVAVVESPDKFGMHLPVPMHGGLSLEMFDLTRGLGKKKNIFGYSREISLCREMTINVKISASVKKDKTIAATLNWTVTNYDLCYSYPIATGDCAANLKIDYQLQQECDNPVCEGTFGASDYCTCP